MRPYRPRQRRYPAWTWFAVTGAGIAAAALGMSVPVGDARNHQMAGADGAPSARASDKASPSAREDGYVRVIDGDTFDIDGERVRIWGIDAPDKPEAMKRAAGRRAAAIIEQEGLTCSTSLAANVALRTGKMCPSSLTSYGRKNAQCRLNRTGEDFGNRMIREGFAVSYKRYDCGFYDELMSKAKLTRSGLWRSYPAQMAKLAELRSRSAKGRY